MIFALIACIVLGMLIGFFCRRAKMEWINKSITLIVCILLFLIGFEIGANKDIISRLHDLGLEALGIAIATLLGSAALSYMLGLLLKSRGIKAS